MRKSAAPSVRRFDYVGSNPDVEQPRPASKPVLCVNQPFQIPHVVRSTASILELLSKKADSDAVEENTNDPFLVTGKSCSVASTDLNISSKENTSTSLRFPVGQQQNFQPSKTNSASISKVTDNKEELPPPGNTVVYTVVWGKQTTRKHKTYEFDGILEVKDKSVVLKDEDGKIIGRTSLKAEGIEEGTQLNVGGKAVEVVELASKPQIKPAMAKRPAQMSDNVEQVRHPPKKMKPTSSQPVALARQRHTFQLDYNPLVMTKPSNEHQWQWNEAHHTVVDVCVDPCLVRVLRPHQREGVAFLYKCVMGMRQLNCHGAILADEMGLGKTLQCITLTWMLLKHGPYGDIPVVKRVLIVTPSSLVVNWHKEFLKWLGQERIQPFVIDQSFQKNKPKDYVQKGRGPVLLISYEMFVRYFEDIQPIGFDLLICDEGHRLKNTTIKASMLLNQLSCKRRVLLTGTPIQNDLQEFFALVDFVNPGILGTRATFHKYYEQPIVASRQPEVDEEVLQLGEERAIDLNNQTSTFIMRRTQEVINKYLPKKQESVVFCCSSPLQQEVYRAAVSYWNDHVNNAGEGSVHLGVITALKKICNHPCLVLPSKSPDPVSVSSNPYRSSQIGLPGSLEDCPVEENLTQYLSKVLLAQGKCMPLPEHSGKLFVVAQLLKYLSSTKEKIILVSYYTQTLDLFVSLCKEENYKYCRLDGSTPTTQRMEIVNQFNSQYSQQFVFLLSARAGGVGLNLTGASRLVLYDSDWNPATDLQAMSRIWRDGQKTSVHIYRLLTAGTIEEKIFQRQISKTGLSGAVVDPHNSNAIRLSNEELKDLFTFHEETFCLTHSLLDCDCPSNGCIPGLPDSIMDEVPEETEDMFSSLRDCQLQVMESKPLEKQSLRMNQLYEWEHHACPFNADVLQEMGLSSASSCITFIFRNNSSI